MHIVPILAEAVVPSGTLIQRLHSLSGLFVFVLIAFLIGKSRGTKSFPWRVVIWGIFLMFLFGSIVLFSPAVLVNIQAAIQKLLDFSNEGCRMVFGNLISYSIPSKTSDGTVSGTVELGFVFAFVVSGTIIFISMLTAMLYHIGVLTWVVHGLAWIMQKTMGTSGAETLSTAANIFVGQTEAPLIVRPFLNAATRSELMAIMVGGFANIASGVLVLYTQLLDKFVPNAGGHLAMACFISAPATLVVAKLICPETQQPETQGGVDFKVERVDANLIDAATRGTSEGLALALNVIAMLIAFTALVALLNGLLGWGTGYFGLGAFDPVTQTHSGWTIQQMLGWVCAPLAWLCGIDWASCQNAGSLLGLKTVLNEFIAYQEMSNQLTAQGEAYLSPRAALISTYALCGFANFASVGIQIGGISTLAPGRRSELSKIGLLAMVGGAIASCMGACVVGVLV